MTFVTRVRGRFLLTEPCWTAKVPIMNSAEDIYFDGALVEPVAELPPKATGRGSGVRQRFVDQVLKANPGQWFRYPHPADRRFPGVTDNKKSFPHTNWTCRSVDGEYRVYAKYDPPPQ